VLSYKETVRLKGWGRKNQYDGWREKGGITQFVGRRAGRQCTERRDLAERKKKSPGRFVMMEQKKTYLGENPTGGRERQPITERSHTQRNEGEKGGGRGGWWGGGGEGAGWGGEGGLRPSLLLKKKSKKNMGEKGSGISQRFWGGSTSEKSLG